MVEFANKADANFWAHQNQYLNRAATNPIVVVNTDKVIQDTAGTGKNHTIRGSAVGAVSQPMVDAANLLFPLYDGATNRLPNNPLGGTPSLAEFTQAHSAHQAEFLAARSRGVTLEGQSFFLDSRNQVHHVQSLQAQDIARMSNADQATLLNHATVGTNFQAVLAAQNLAHGTAANARFIDPVTNQPVTPAAFADSVIAAMRAEANTKFPLTDINIFAGQIENIKTRMTGASIFAPDLILEDIKTIQTRFNRAKEFANVPAEIKGELEVYNYLRYERRIAIPYSIAEKIKGPDTHNYGSYYSHIKSLDQDETIKKGYTEFMRAERQILAADNRRIAVANYIRIDDPKMDVPNLIFRMQSLYEVETGAVSDSETEEIRQQHKLLKDYAEMQQLINETIKAFDPSETDQKRRFLNAGNLDDTQYHNDFHEMSGTEQNELERIQQLRWKVGGVTEKAHNIDARGAYTINTWPGDSDIVKLISMFNDVDITGKGVATQHPLEKLLGISRPTANIFTHDGALTRQTKTQWETFGTQLADRVTIINQNNQIRQNDINSATKAKNRHFDLANNALAKMNEMLLTIGRM